MRLLAGLTALILAVGPARADAQADRARHDIQNLDKTIASFTTKRGNYPDKLRDLVTAGFVDPKATLRDPWGTEYQYDPKGKRNAGKKADRWAVGPDKVEIGNWPTNEKK